jgi:hypothetical protein
MKLHPRFSLRTLFVLAVAIGIISYFVFGQLSWIKQRHQFVTVEKGIVISRSSLAVPTLMHSEGAVANSVPWSLWVFGEPSYEEVRIYVESEEGVRVSHEYWQNDLDERTENELLSASDRERLERAKQLFPEAIVVKASFFPAEAANK